MFATIFNAIVSNSKHPYSPYGDKTYDFKVVEFETKYDFLRLLSKFFVLNISLDGKKVQSVRSVRRKTELKQYFSETAEYIIIDVDDVHTLEMRNKILNYFKQFDCMICESRSYNGIDNFNLKGILILEPVKNETLKFVAAQIKQRLKTFCNCNSDNECNFDLASSHNVKYNAPIQKFNVLLENSGVPYKFVYDNSIKSYKKSNKSNFEVISKQDYSDIKCIEDLCLKYFQSIGFEAFETSEDCIKFKHPSEQKTPGGYFWFRDSPYIMHHYNEVKNINIFDIISKMPESKELLRNAIKYEDTFGKNALLIDVNFKYLELTKDIRDNIDTFLSKPSGVFAIRSPMGTGKSTIINEIIVDALEQDMRVLIITNRVSVAEDFSEKYHLKLYNKDKYNINDSLICQYDSLYKYNIKYFDLVIFDEFISVLLHSRNNLNNTIINLSKFYACFKTHVVIADAFLTGYENFIMPKNDMIAINNTYRDETKLFMYNNFNYFILTILKTSERNKITISCTSIKVIKALKELLKKYNLRVITLTAETPESTKQLIYEKFKLEENNIWDVLIYSPTLTVGVSNLNNVKCHFHYDNAMTCDVVSSLQMIKRTRKASEIHLYIKNRINYVKTNFNDLKDTYIHNLGKVAEHNELFTFNDYGEPRLSKIGKNAIKTDIFKNILEYNHKQAFLFLAQFNFKESPVFINNIYEANILKPYLNTVKDETMQNNLEIIDTYFMLNGFDCSEILTMYNDNNLTIKRIENIYTKIKPETPIDIVKEMVVLEFTKPFIDKCIKYIYTYNLTNGIYTDDDIRNKISDLLNHNSNDVNYWISLLKLDKSFVLKDSYNKKFVINNDNLKKLLEECGYKLYNKDNDIVGLQRYEVDHNILKYKEYVKNCP